MNPPAFDMNEMKNYGWSTPPATPWDAAPVQMPSPTPGVTGGMPSGYQHQAPTMASYQANPYLNQMAQGITGQFNQNLGQNLQGIRSNSVAAGGLGGSRQGVAEGTAIGQANTGLANALTGMYSQDYQQDRNRALQELGMNQNYMLGNRGMDVTMRGQDIGWQLGQRNADLTQRGQDIQWQDNYNQTLDRREGLRNNFYLGNRNADLTHLGIGTNFYGDLLRTAASGSGTTGTGSDGGFDWQKAVGTAGQAYQFGKNIWGW